MGVSALRPRTPRFHPWAAAIVLGVVSLGIHLWRLDSSGPDVVFDETAYTRAAWYLGHTGHLNWGEGAVFIHPPIFFMLESAWLHLASGAGPAGAQLFNAVYFGRLFSVAMSAVLAPAVFALAYNLLAESRRRTLCAVIAGVLVLLDPVVVHFGRLVVIEPTATALLVLTLLAAWMLRDATTARWYGTIGLLTGLCLLTKELTVFFLLTPALFGLLTRAWQLVRRAAGAFAIGGAMWAVVVFGWAIALGQLHLLLHTKFFTLERLLGIVQTTGLNRAGVSPVASISDKAPVYGASYVLLVVGAAAWVLLAISRRSDGQTFVLAAVTTSYAFAGYTAGVGQFNEQFFYYVMPFAALGAGTIASLTIRGWELRGVAIGAASLVAILACASYWITFATQDDHGFQQLAAFVDMHVPRCAIVNTSGEIEAWQWADPNNSFVNFASGPAAADAGVEYFLLSPTAAANRYPNMSPELEHFIESGGTPLAIYASREYGTYRLYRVPFAAFVPGAGEVVGTGRPASMYVATLGASCGGYSVSDAAPGRILDAYRRYGGRVALGAPTSRAWQHSGTQSQAFSAGVLTSAAGLSPGSTRLAPVVAGLLSRRPKLARAMGVSASENVPAGSASTGVAGVDALLTDHVIRDTFLGRGDTGAAGVRAAIARWGAPLGPPVATARGAVRQAFADVIFTRMPGASTAVLEPISSGLAAAGMVPASALRPEAQTVSGPVVWDTTHGWVGWLLVLIAVVCLAAAAPLVWDVIHTRRSRRGDAS